MIRLTGKGESIPDGVSGDLYIKVHVRSHPTLRKEGYHLVMDLKIKLSDALLGAKYTIQTLDGAIELKIPENVGHNEILRVRGKGVPMGGERTGKRGDLLIRLNIELPKKLSRKAKKIIEDQRGEGI